MLNNPPDKDYIKKLRNKIFKVHAFSQVKKRFNRTIEESIISLNPVTDSILPSAPYFHKDIKVILSTACLKYLFKTDKRIFLNILLNSGVLVNIIHLSRLSKSFIFKFIKK